MSKNASHQVLPSSNKENGEEVREYDIHNAVIRIFSPKRPPKCNDNISFFKKERDSKRASDSYLLGGFQ